MANQKKTLYTVGVVTAKGTFTAADSATSSAGVNALMAFQSERTILIPGEESDTYIPFHAVLSVAVTTTTSESQYKDEMCE